jgi:hypothetical protein
VTGFQVPEVDRCDATSKSSPSKLRADPTPLHATEVLIATLSDPRENTLPETSEGPTIAVRRLALMELQLGMLAGSAEAYQPGTAVADHRDTEEAVTRVLDAYR